MKLLLKKYVLQPIKNFNVTTFLEASNMRVQNYRLLWQVVF